MSKVRMKFLNTHIDNVTMAEALEVIDEFIQDGESHYVVTPNVDHIVKLENDEEFKEVYNNADLILADGMPLIWISKALKNEIKEKVSGADLLPKVCELCAKKGYSIFLLGAAEGVAVQAANNLKNKYRGLNVVGTYSPSYGFESNEEEIENIVKLINIYKPHVLAVGLGSPKQEKFIYKYKTQLTVPVALAIGASIDFEAGNIKRAPKCIQNCGLEWLYRFFNEPRRLFKRYFLDDIKIIRIIMKYRQV